MKQRIRWDEDLLVTDLKWNPRVISHSRAVRSEHGRGALVGTLLGVPVDGRACGRGTAYQFKLLTGEIHTAFWDGTLHHGAPCLFDIDTEARLPLFSPVAFAWFARLEDVK